MRETRLDGCGSLPLVLEPGSEAGRSRDHLVEWIGGRRAALEERLDAAGAVLFRGFALASAEDFEAVAESFQPRLSAYLEGQSQRERVRGNVYTSTSYPAREKVTLHNELSYTASPPRHLLFFCCVAPEDGGETPLLDCRRVLEALKPEVVRAFEERGVLYVKNMHGGGPGTKLGKSWQQHFETEDRGEVEAHLAGNGVGFEWRPDGGLRTRQVRPGLCVHPRTGERLWFNQASLWHVSNLGAVGRQLLRTVGEEELPTHAYFGDGGAIDPADLDHVRRTTWDEASRFPWRAGDVVLADNHRVAHGRNRFSGKRRILAALG